MNRNEWEQRMKDLAEEQSFPPDEANWLKLSAALQQPALPVTPRKRLLFTPVRMAAAVALLLSAGAALWISLRQPGGQEQKISLSYRTALPAATEIASPKPDATPTLAPNSTAVAAASVPARQAVTANTFSQAVAPPAEKKFTATETITLPPSPGPAFTAAENRQPGKADLSEDPFALWHSDAHAPNPAPSAGQALHLGLNAQVGSSTVSPAVYQVGIVGRRELSRKLYVEAGFALASNTVNNVSRHTFSTIEHNAASGVSSVSTSEVEADYSRNIVSLGFSPSIGLKATRKLSVSAGAAINRNLNPSLAITNSAEIAEDALSKHIVSTSQAITNWDIGLTCNAGYQVTPHLSMNIGYRRGLSDYLLQNNSYLKNSGVQFGLKYLFGRKP